MQDDPRYVREAFAAGASRLRAQGGGRRRGRRGGPRGRRRRPLRPPGARRAARRRRGRGERARAEADPLSDREREVLRLLALGHTNQEIAKMLYISVRTAETHRAHIMQKLRLSTRAELVRYALEHGLLDEQPSLTASVRAESCAREDRRGRDSDSSAREAVLGAGLDEELRRPRSPRDALPRRPRASPRPLEHDVRLVVVVRLLRVGLGCDEDVDADLESAASGRRSRSSPSRGREPSLNVGGSRATWPRPGLCPASAFAPARTPRQRSACSQRCSGTAARRRGRRSRDEPMRDACDDRAPRVSQLGQQPRPPP